MGSGKPRGMRAGGKLKNHRRLQKWNDKDYNKSHIVSKWKTPFMGASHASGIVVKRVSVEAKQPNSACRKCVKVQLRKNSKNITAFVPGDGNLEFIDENDRVLISPLARKLADEKGVDISSVKGSGDNGRIIKRDIDSFKHSNYSQFSQPRPQLSESSYETQNSTMRKAIAKRLADSKFSAPHYYLNVELEMDNMISFRKQFIQTQNIKISFNDIIAKAVSLSLAKHPKVNSRWYDDKIIFNEHVHLGVAVAVEDGLIVPVVKYANSKDLPQINTEIKDFAGRAKDKKLTPAEIEGSTFTISNLGMFGIESFTSIINQPNSAILSIGAIVQKPIIKNNEIMIGNTMKLTLACDHRTVDGATGSLFLKTLKEYIENPVSILI